MKTCSVCRQQKELNHFYRDKSAKDGRQRLCCSCSRERSQNQERISPYQLRIRKRNDLINWRYNDGN